MDLLGNFARTTLADVGGIDDTTLTITVTDASEMPTRDFHIILEPNNEANREIVHIESRSGGTLTAYERGAKGTTAVAHAENVQVVNSALAHNFPIHVDRSTLNNPDYANLRAGSDEFDDDEIHSDWVEVKNPSNTSTTTWTEGNDVMSCYHDGLDSTSEMIAMVRPMNGLTGPVTIEVAQKCLADYATNFLMWGIVFSDNPNYGSGNQIFSRPYVNSNTAGFQTSFQSGTGWTADTVHGSVKDIHMIIPLYSRVRWNGDNTWECFWSSDGVSWIRYPDLVATHAFTPTHFGLWLSHWGNTRTTISTWEYFRVY